MKTCAVILGSYVNGYAIAHELYSHNIKDLVLISRTKQLGWYSKYFKNKYLIDLDTNHLLTVLREIHCDYDRLVIYPTDDWFVEALVTLNEELSKYAYLPINPQVTLECSDKYVQYMICEQIGVPYPKTVKVSSSTELDEIAYSIPFPIIFKPAFRADLKIDVFRSKRFNTKEEFLDGRNQVLDFVNKGVEFIVSEIIPGTSSGTIYAYSGYLTKESKIANEWVGRKLSQYPDDYGVYSSASNEAPDIILSQGRSLVKALNCYGFIEPEFKYDYRDGKYKLMEVNLRPMMWHELGFRTGVHMHYTQWCLATQQTVPCYTQERAKKVVLRYFKHEILNYINRDNYRSLYKQIVSDKNVFHAGFYRNDMIPAIVDMYKTSKNIIHSLLKKLK